jgi:hypothetical protein
VTLNTEVNRITLISKRQINNIMKKIALLFASIFLIASCTKSAKKTLGLVETIPDEYKVKRSKSLEVPPSYQQRKSKAIKKGSKFSKAEQELLKEAK